MFSELVCQSYFSFLHGASSPEEIVTTAAFLGYRAVAITDECSVAGVVRAHREIQRQSLPVQLIVGSLFQYNDDLEFVLLCPNKAAYSELCRIITNARRRSAKGSYQLSTWDIRTIKHCIVLWLPTLNDETNKKWGDFFSQLSPHSIYIAASRLLDGFDHKRFECIKSLVSDYSFPVIATSRVLFHHPDRQKIQHVVHAVRTHTPVACLGQEALGNAERSLRQIAKLKRLFPDSWLANTLTIASQCQFTLNELKYHYPNELIPKGYSPISYLRHLVNKGIAVRFPNGVSDEILTTINRELDLIESQHYEAFFLTIYDIVQFAKANNILYQGRGSAANSIVCYCLEITAVDPRRISVLFERFISKERDEPPDIDVDFEHDRREEIIQYIYTKYGRQRTALAASVITYRLKSALRDVGGALGFDASAIDHYIKSINQRDRALSWKSQLAASNIDITQPKIAQLIELSESIIGFPRHLSQHVGGFIISDGPLYDLVPIENAAMEERTVIQWDKDDLETLGLLKVDVLALGMLSAIRRMLGVIHEHYQFALTVSDIVEFGDDPQVFNMICQADTVGVFQIESRAQMSMLPRLKPRNYYDLVVQIAIVRPGPIQGDMVHPYLKRRSGVEAVDYPSEAIRSVLMRTLGVPIFQEQVIQLAMVAAGFTGGEADQLRRAMASWKKDGRIYEFKDKLVNGMKRNNYTEAFAERLFEQIKGFGGYGFPESHSASFALLAYVSSWIKYYFPHAFYTGLLNSLPMGFYSASQLIQDGQRHGITFNAPCINSSMYEHSLAVKSGNPIIQLGFKSIHSISEKTGLLLLTSRPEKGFHNISDVIRTGISQSQLNALASADALRTITTNRFDARWKIMDSNAVLPLFECLPGEAYPVEPSDLESLREDYASTGYSIHHHPVKILCEQGCLKGYSFANQLSDKKSGSVVRIIGCITAKQAPSTAAGVMFLTVEDHTGNINVVVWQTTSREQYKTFMHASIVEIAGILEISQDGVIHLIAGKFTDKTHLLSDINVVSRDFH